MIARRAAVLVVLVSMGVPAAAAADAPWSAPTRVAGRSGSLYDVWFGNQGGGLLSALCCGGFGPGVPGTRVARTDPSGSFGRWRTVSRSIGTEAFAGSGSERYAFGWIRGAHGRTDTGFARVTAKGLGPIFRVFPPLTVSAKLARVPNGTSALIGQVSASTTNDRTRRSIYLTVRRHGHGFSKPVKLAGTGDRAWLGVAVTPSGRALAAWIRSGGLFARERLANGRLLPTERIGDVPEGSELTVGLAPDGTAAIAWLGAPGGLGPRSVVIALTTRRPGHRFGILRSLEQLATGTEQPRMAPVNFGRLMVSWIGYGGSVRATTTDGGRPTKVQILPSSNATDLHLVSTRPGEEAVVWTEGARVLRAALAVAGPGTNKFGEPATISGPATIGPATLAYDPSRARVAVAWTENDAVLQSYARLTPP